MQLGSEHFSHLRTPLSLQHRQETTLSKEPEENTVNIREKKEIFVSKMAYGRIETSNDRAIIKSESPRHLPRHMAGRQ